MQTTWEAVILIFIAFLSILLLYLIWKLPPSGGMVASIEISRIGIAAAVLASLNNNSYQSAIIALSSFAFVLGFYLTTRKWRVKCTQQGLVSIPVSASGPLIIIVGIVVLGSAIHYSIIGIPLFAADINMSRFSSADSGFLGVPSRIATYGPSLLAILGFIILIWNQNIPQPKRLIRMAWLLIAVSMITTILRGHKASLLGLVFIFLALSRFLPKAQMFRSLGYLAITGSMLVLMAGVQAVFLFGNGINSQAIINYLYERIFLSGPDALQVAVNSKIDHIDISDSSALIGEILYPFQRLVGIHEKLYVLKLSHILYGVPDDDFSVPVTPSIIAPAVHDFGLELAPLFIFMVGTIFGLIVNQSRKSFSSLFFWISVEVLLFQGIARGAVFYILLNGLVLLIPTWIALRLRISGSESIAPHYRGVA